MAIKYTIQGLLIYEAIGLYAMALLISWLKFRRLSLVVYGLGFAAAVTALVYRGVHVNHFPLQNLFEVFLFLGSLAFPLTLLSMKFLKTNDFLPDIIIGIVDRIRCGPDAGLSHITVTAAFIGAVR